jgi:hypothetical protein
MTSSLSIEAETTLNKLPAVKLKLERAIVKSYSNPAKYSKEIFEHKTINKDLIKFISLKDDILMIATDDKDTHDELIRPWPLDAFGSRMILLQNRPSRQETNKYTQKTRKTNPLTLHLIGIHPDIENNDTEFSSLLEKHDLINPTRITSKRDRRTNIIQVEANSTEAFDNALNSTITLYHSRIKCTTPPEQVKQCFKCQLKGHTKHTCKNGTRCLRCGGQHSYKTDGEITCPNNAPTKCVNCGDSHFACSRECRYLNEDDFLSINPEHSKQNKLNTTKHKHSTHQNNSTKSPSSTQAHLEKSITSLFNAEIEKFRQTINKITEKAIQTIQDTIQSIDITNTIKTQVDQKFKGITEERYVALTCAIAKKIQDRIRPEYLNVIHPHAPTTSSSQTTPKQTTDNNNNHVLPKLNQATTPNTTLPKPKQQITPTINSKNPIKSNQTSLVKLSTITNITQ